MLKFVRSANEFQGQESGTNTGLSCPQQLVCLPVLVYGREVDDFHLADYKAIAILHVPATPELARQNE